MKLKAPSLWCVVTFGYSGTVGSECYMDAHGECKIRHCS